MDDREVLRHLLGLEAEADSLVSDAQEEADRRIAGGERQNRSRYEEAYSAEVEVLEEGLKRSIAAEKEKYDERLKEFHESLAERPVDMEAFSELAGKHLGLKGL